MSAAGWSVLDFVTGRIFIGFVNTSKLARSKNMPLADRRKKNEFNRVAAIYKFKARIPKFYFYTAKFRNVYEKRGRFAKTGYTSFMNKIMKLKKQFRHQRKVRP